MLRAIQEIKPKFVIAENVFGITNIDGGLVFQQVCLDLENEGYEVQPFIIPAAAKNAPHRRDRCWFIATNTKSNGSSIGKLGESQTKQQVQTGSDIDGFESLGNATNTKSKRSSGLLIRKKKTHTVNGIFGSNGNATDTKYLRCENRQQQGQPRCEKGLFKGVCINGNVANTTSTGRRKDNRFRESRFNDQESKTNNWENFPTQSPVCGGDDGISTELDGITFPKWRAESIKGYGNAIVPQIAYSLFEIIQELNENN